MKEKNDCGLEMRRSWWWFESRLNSLAKAMLSLALQATALGLNVHQNDGSNENRLRCELPADVTPTTITAVGYQGEVAQLHETFYADENMSCQRNPLAKKAFLGNLPKLLRVSRSKLEIVEAW